MSISLLSVGPSIDLSVGPSVGSSVGPSFTKCYFAKDDKIWIKKGEYTKNIRLYRFYRHVQLFMCIINCIQKYLDVQHIGIDGCIVDSLSDLLISNNHKLHHLISQLIILSNCIIWIAIKNIFPTLSSDLQMYHIVQLHHLTSWEKKHFVQLHHLTFQWHSGYSSLKHYGLFYGFSYHFHRCWIMIMLME